MEKENKIVINVEVDGNNFEKSIVKLRDALNNSIPNISKDDQNPCHAEDENKSRTEQYHEDQNIEYKKYIKKLDMIKSKWKKIKGDLSRDINEWVERYCDNECKWEIREAEDAYKERMISAREVFYTGVAHNAKKEEEL